MPARKVNVDRFRTLSVRELAEVFKISDPVLMRWKKEGTDIQDAREVFLRLYKLQKRPPMWKIVFSKLAQGPEQDSHEFWKKEKDKAATEGLRLKNAKVAGDLFERADGERVQMAWAAALNLAHAELMGKLPEQIAGRDHAVVADILETEFHRIHSELADLESGLWAQIFDEYAKGQPVDEGAGGGDDPAPATKRKRVVRNKRKPRSRADPKA